MAHERADLVSPTEGIASSAARVSVPADIVYRLRAWAATKPQIRRLWLYGSRVQGTATDESDLDIAFDASIPELDRISLVEQWEREIAEWCPYKPSVQSIGTLLPSGELVSHVVAREGVHIYPPTDPTDLAVSHSDELLERAIRGLEETVHFFSAGAAQQEQQDRYVVEHFLRALGIEFDASEIKRPPQDPPDQTFRDAAFEVKEILDDGRRRGDEYKKQLARARAAKSFDELTDQVAPEDITIAALYSMVMAKTKRLATTKYVNARDRASLDLLFYVDLQNAWALLDGSRPSVEPLVAEGWRSVSFLFGGLTAGVIVVTDAAPSFLKGFERRFVHGPGG